MSDSGEAEQLLTVEKQIEDLKVSYSLDVDELISFLQGLIFNAPGLHTAGKVEVLPKEKWSNLVAIRDWLDSDYAFSAVTRGQISRVLGNLYNKETALNRLIRTEGADPVAVSTIVAQTLETIRKEKVSSISES